MGEDNVPAAERVFGAGHELRPNFVQPYRCKNVLIEGVTFTNSPMWIVNPVLCENVTIRGVTVDSHGPNNDGCNPESCRNVLIENCTFDTGDDCIAIKSGRNADGRRIGVPSENIIIRGCTMKDGHGGVVLGSEMSGGIRNVFVEDCADGQPQPRPRDPAQVELDARRLPRKPVRPQRQGRPGRRRGGPHQSQLRQGSRRRTTRRSATSSSRASPRSGASTRSTSPASTTRRFENVVLENCTFKNAAKASVIENVDEITLRNFTLLPKEGIDRN